MLEIVVRFLLGGAIVSAFAVLGDVFTPKTFAGVFGAAPSVALATLALTWAMHGGHVAAVEGRSMLIAAAAFLVYGVCSAWVVRLEKLRPWLGAIALWGVWLAVAFAARAALLR